MARQTHVAVAAGRADFAVAIGTEALMIANETGSRRTMQVLRTAAEEMSEFSDNRQVRELRTALKEKDNEE